MIYSGYIALQGETPEVIVEFDYADHQRTDTPGPDGSTSSVYGQLAYRLPGRAANFKPYLRAEHLDVEDDDPLLSPLVDSYDGVTAACAGISRPTPHSRPRCATKSSTMQTMK